MKNNINPLNKYYSKNKSKNRLFEIALFFINILFTLSCISFTTISNLGDNLYVNYPDYLTCSIYKSEVVTLDNSSLAIEKTYKLSTKELTSLNRYISHFSYSYSLNSFFNKTTFLYNKEEINVNVIPVFPNTNLINKYQFDEYDYNEILVNESFTNKFGNIDSFDYTYESIIEKEEKKDLVIESGKFFIRNITDDKHLINDPCIYVNVDRFISYLETIELENISTNLRTIYTLNDYYEDDTTGENNNEYSYLIGVSKLKDIKILKKLCSNCVYKISSYSLDLFDTLQNVFDVIKVISQFFFTLCIATLLLMSIINTYNIFIKTRKDIGLFLSFGAHDFAIYFNVLYCTLKKLLFSYLITFICLIILGFITFNFLPILGVILSILKYIILTLVFILFSSFIFVLPSYITFKFLKIKNVNKLIKED